MKIIIHIVLIFLLTMITQVGGFIYLVVLFIPNYLKLNAMFGWRVICFVLLYTFSIFLIIPHVAPIFGREPVSSAHGIAAQSFFYRLANRHYVRPELNESIDHIAKQFNNKYPNLRLIHLDANFPFFNHFPLIPHLSHHDGKKIDLSFVYQSEEGVLSNKKPSVSGYGSFEVAKESEEDWSSKCSKEGFWLYDKAKYLTLGIMHPDLQLAEVPTRYLIQLICQEPKMSKVFIEPYLKQRLKLSSPKIRFHGCHAVRHDDHIHLQIK